MSNPTKGLIGRKLGMTQIFTEEGDVLPVTVIELGPCTVTQVKSDDGRDGYNAIQLSFDTKRPALSTKSERGHAAKSGLAAAPKVLREFRLNKADLGAFAEGKQVTVSDIFETGKRVDVVGTSKGRGFAGVMKRHNFRGFIRSHGTHEFFRHGGSIGTRLTPGMVFKGKKMPGHMGNARTTIQNLKVARIDVERNLIFVQGGVPGPNGGIVTVRNAVK